MARPSPRQPSPDGVIASPHPSHPYIDKVSGRTHIHLQKENFAWDEGIRWTIMAEFKKRLTLGGSLAALLLAAAIVAFQYFYLGVSLDAKAREPILTSLRGIYAPQLDSLIRQAADGGAKEAAKLSEQAAALDKIQIKSLGARRSSKDDYIVRVEYLIDGKLPPDGVAVRYFKMEWQTLGGWRVKWESNAFSYYSSLKFW